MTDWTPPNSEYPPPRPGEPELHRAARVGDHDAIRACAEAGTDLDDIFNRSQSPVTWPIEVTPLMVAAGSEDGATVETIRLLLELGADPTVTKQGLSAASWACAGEGWDVGPGGDVASLRFLLDAGSPLNHASETGNRMFCRTAERGDTEMLRLLLEQGADPNAYGNDDLDDYEIPIFQAAESGSIECVQLLLDHGANIRIRDSSDRTALWYTSSLPVIRLLLSKGLSLEDRDEYNWSPLDDAVGGESEEDDAIPRIKSLIEAGADVNATHDHGFTVFMMAASGMDRHVDVLDLLVKAGADPHAISDLGHNAFHAAIDVNGEANEKECAGSILGFLRDLGVDIDHKNNAGLTPIAHAMNIGNGLEARVLAELGADINAAALRHVCGNKSCSYIESPLIFAAIDAAVNRDEKVEALLKAGANLNVVNEQGQRPIEFAREELADLLRGRQDRYTREWVVEARRTIQLLEEAAKQSETSS